jgi:hypothetical protein
MVAFGYLKRVIWMTLPCSMPAVRRKFSGRFWRTDAGGCSAMWLFGCVADSPADYRTSDLPRFGVAAAATLAGTDALRCYA